MDFGTKNKLLAMLYVQHKLHSIDKSLSVTPSDVSDMYWNAYCEISRDQAKLEADAIQNGSEF